jgi:hypothetical protein
MSQTTSTEDSGEDFFRRFPESLEGTWSTFGDGYQMEHSRAATFCRDGTGLFEIWGVFEENEQPSSATPFRWTAKDGFVVEVTPCDAKFESAGWGSFTAQFYLSSDDYGNKFVALCDDTMHQQGDPFWWFDDPAKHPMRLMRV